MCHKGKSLRLAAASLNVKKEDLVTLKKKETSLWGNHRGALGAITSPSYQLRLTPPHPVDTSDSSCTSSSTYSSMSSADSARRNNKQVSFKSTVKIYQIQSWRCFKRSQLAEMYHTIDELIAIRNEYIRQLRIIQLEEDLPDGEDEDSDICSRGMEHETKEGRRERQIHRRAALASVLREQERQRKLGIVHPTSIARLYSLTTKDSVYAAIEKGAWDAYDAKSYV